MSFLKTQAPEESPALAAINEKLTAMFGMVPQVFTAMNLRTDLLAPMVEYVNQLLIVEHELPRASKELIAAHVSRLNSCAY